MASPKVPKDRKVGPGNNVENLYHPETQFYPFGSYYVPNMSCWCDVPWWIWELSKSRLIKSYPSTWMILVVDAGISCT
jgi:hypothetical protein